MNRRAAIAALVALPATAKISVAQVQPRDVLVLECDEQISTAMAENIRTAMKNVWPDHQCVVLGRGMHLKVLSEATNDGAR